ncbi:MAG: hypothetical protein RLY93_03115 [Sumerlaeia bacterium]
MIAPYGHLLRTCTILVSLGLASTVPAQDGPKRLADAIDPDWAKASLWDDGQAEVATYEGERVIYGEARPHTHHLITVKEDFNRDFMVKADWPYDDKPLMTVLKQNQVATIPTPNYPYHYMASVFFDREDIGRAVKMTVSSQEWCGITTKDVQFWEEPPVYRYTSYWDGQGMGEAKVPEAAAENTFFEEELPLLVRTLEFGDELELEFELMPNQTTSRAKKPDPVEAQARVTREEDAGWRIAVRAADGRELNFTVANDEVNTLRAYSLGEGRSYTLANVERWPYWERRPE